MNISLTWADYALIVSVCLAVYYLIILFFYRKSLNGFLSAKTTPGPHSPTDLFTAEAALSNSKGLNLFGEAIEVQQILGEDQDFTPDAQAFADEIQAYTSSCGNDIGKEELIQNLRKIVQKYPSLIGSDSQYELSQLIAISSENNCSIHLSADELSELWNG